MIETFINALLHFIEASGYWGLLIMATAESTFLPVPSEITMIPAGYLIYQGKLALAPTLASCIGGTMFGAYINYGIAFRYGRRLLLRHPRFFMMDKKKLEKIEKFFTKHGAVSIFTGRLIFGVRHYISFPAGLAKMDMKEFTFFTFMGGSLWVAALLGLGYLCGGNEQELEEFLPLIKTAILGLAVATIMVYRYRIYLKQKKKS